MTRYQLAKLIAWAGTLQSRKKMQKVVFMLQAAGFPVEADYRLHHFGPYSDDVAHLADEMVQVGLLQEEEKPNALIGNTYDYRLSDKAVAALAEYEATVEGKQHAATLNKYETQAKRLLRADLKALEYAATIVYFKRSGLDWPVAMEKACAFKKVKKNSRDFRQAESLAREIVT